MSVDKSPVYEVKAVPVEKVQSECRSSARNEVAGTFDLGGRLYDALCVLL